jgi:general secretion pathway protein D
MVLNSMKTTFFLKSRKKIARSTLSYFLTLSFVCLPPALYIPKICAQAISDQAAIMQKIDASASDSLISVSYENEDLVTIINQLAAQSGNNILLPQGGLALKEKVTLHLPEKVSIEHAWSALLPTILDTAGFTIYKKGNTYSIKKNDKDIGREPMPIYIGTPAEKLPNTDQRIRYLFYPANIKVAAFKDTLQTLLVSGAGLLPTDTIFETDNSSNAIILVAKANDIKNAMKILVQLDQPGFQEKMEIIHLTHTAAPTVAAIFNDGILKAAQDKDRYKLDAKKESRETYFSDSVKIIPENRSNSLIVLGRTQAVERIKDFINNYIDVALDSGSSVLHVYQLQYLDAIEFKPTLERIVKSEGIGGTGQSRGDKESAATTERFFDEVVISIDQPENAKDTKYYGSNKLIIACRNDDWKQIKQLLEKLDTPMDQVLIEVLIADLTLKDSREIGTIFRNPEKIPMPGNMNFQSAHFGNIITNDNANPTTIKSDLLRNDGIVTVTPPVSAAQAVTTGATAISLNDPDGQTYSLMQIFKGIEKTKILSHPHIITTNNKEALVQIGESRLLRDEASGSTGGAATQTFKRVYANLEVTITPRISAGDLINLEIKIKIDEFVSATDDSRITRRFNTNANVADGGILALGGLVRRINSVAERKTPFLSSIPVLGYFFKDRSGEADETNLTVWILPHRVKARLRPGVSEYTKDYIKLAKDYAQEGSLFSGLKDPVTRWFFKPNGDTSEILDSFLAKDEFKLDLTEFQKPVDAPEIRDAMQAPVLSQNNTAPEQAKSGELAKNNKTETPQTSDREQILKNLVKDSENPLKVASKTPETKIVS